MTILLYESVGTNNFMTAYRDSDDPTLFYYAPQFAALSSRPDGRLNFGAQLFKRNENDPNDGFAVFNFGVNGVIPSDVFNQMLDNLKQNYGSDAKLAPISPDAEHPSLHPLTTGIYQNLQCQTKGVNLYTDLAASFTVDERIANDMKDFFQNTANALAGQVDFSVRTKKTEFEWKITANWHRIHEHFKSQVSVKYWFVSANLSYETQKLIQDEVLKIETTGGTPQQKELIYTMASKIAGRLFKPQLRHGPMPGHPSGSALCVSVNYQRTEENVTSKWEGKENDYEVKPLGMAAYVGDVPDDYFSGFDDGGVFYAGEGPYSLIDINNFHT